MHKKIDDVIPEEEKQKKRFRTFQQGKCESHKRNFG